MCKGPEAGKPGGGLGMEIQVVHIEYDGGELVVGAGRVSRRLKGSK